MVNGRRLTLKLKKGLSEKVKINVLGKGNFRKLIIYYYLNKLGNFPFLKNASRCSKLVEYYKRNDI